jgi:hypothetical protein
MKKVLAFAFVAGMIAFASCTSKPAEEAATDSTATMMEVDTTMAVDTMPVDSGMTLDSL